MEALDVLLRRHVVELEAFDNLEGLPEKGRQILATVAADR